MWITNRSLSIVWKLIIVAVATAGVLMQTGVFDGGSPGPVMLGYFTVISNVLVAIYFLVDAIWMMAKPQAAAVGDEWAIGFKHIVLVGIVMTCIIANLFLGASFSGMSGTMATSMQLLHVFSPVFVVLDWLLFERKGQMAAIDPLIALILPLAYFFCVVTCVGVFKLDLNPLEVSSLYPYPFIDIARLSGQQLAINVAGIIAGFLLVGFIIFAIDHALASYAAKRASAAAATDSGSGSGKAIG